MHADRAHSVRQHVLHRIFIASLKAGLDDAGMAKIYLAGVRGCTWQVSNKYLYRLPTQSEGHGRHGCPLSI